MNAYCETCERMRGFVIKRYPNSKKLDIREAQLQGAFVRTVQFDDCSHRAELVLGHADANDDRVMT